ncbi:MAG: hypothetical protein Q9171_001166 [Xanthocarpia ochracea]
MTEDVSISEVASVDSEKAKQILMGDLDVLLERYLDLVHQYNSLHQSISKEFASGYLSLAQANFSNHNRLRYGQDFYDDRMQASTKFLVKPPTDELFDDADDERLLKYTISLFTLQPASGSPETTKSTADEASTKSQTDIESKPPTSDPLKWFGILVPPALRASQNSFKNAVTEKITLLANLSNEMRSMEIEIRRIRKKIKKLG